LMPGQKTTPFRKDMQPNGGRNIHYPDEAFFDGSYQNYQQNQ
jgi:hypothetical protein